VWDISILLQKEDFVKGLLRINALFGLEYGVGFSQANRREARKLGLLLSSKSSEAERE
jgi:chorismate synthase